MGFWVEIAVRIILYLRKYVRTRALGFFLISPIIDHAMPLNIQLFTKFSLRLAAKLQVMRDFPERLTSVRDNRNKLLRV
jgi:hypothetical protein